MVLQLAHCGRLCCTVFWGQGVFREVQVASEVCVWLTRGVYIVVFVRVSVSAPSACVHAHWLIRAKGVTSCMGLVYRFYKNATLRLVVLDF